MTVEIGSERRVDAPAFRAALSRVASAVSVVTTAVDGVPHGTTVSAFTSLSLEPPMVVVALDQRSDLLAKLTTGSRVGLTVLAAHQDQIALRFARKGDDKFAGVPWHLVDGAPALTDGLAWIAGRVDRLIPAGDHVLALIDVVAASSNDHAPLTYWQRTFGTHKAF